MVNTASSLHWREKNPLTLYRIWDDYRPSHMVGMDFMKTGYKARDKVYGAFRQYFQDIPADASYLVRERQRLMLEGGISKLDACKMQSTLSDAAYPNTVPTMFWTVYEIYSRPELLEAVRQEISRNALRESNDKFTLDVALLKAKCPLLLSAFQETQRVRHYQVAFRAITEDTLLDGKYLLKKGNYLQMPAKPTHQDRKVWGEDAHVFDPYRFVPAGAGANRNKAKILPSSFLPWGAPPHMCPARQFASTEIIIIAALLILRVDFTPEDGKGWERDPALRSMEIPSLPRPKKDVLLKLSPRREALGDWSIMVGQSTTRMPLASG